MDWLKGGGWGRGGTLAVTNLQCLLETRGGLVEGWRLGEGRNPGSNKPSVSVRDPWWTG